MNEPVAYPCFWEFRIIGTDETSLQQAAAECLPDSDFRFALANTSRGGTYLSATVRVEVPDEQIRNRIYQHLRAHPAVKMVL